MAKEKKRKTPNPYIRAVMWKVIDIITALLPILIFTIVQWDEYFGKSSEYAFKNILGLAMMILIVSLAVAKKLKLANLLGISGLFTLMFYLLQQIINDLVVISFMVFIGSFLSKTITNPIMRKWERIKDKTETADINAAAMERVVEKASRSGRV